ncbi:MAG: hypothetical protein LC772_02730 [Chloroflexi bacterium]|nr:hypothetical protein [Chloroflexota bacterium]
MTGRLLDVGEGKVAILVGDVGDLVKARQSVFHMRRVGEGFLALVGERVDALGQIRSLRQIAVLGVRLPCCLVSAHWWYLLMRFYPCGALI